MSVPEECDALARRLSELGVKVWSWGWMAGPDRIAERTKHGIGDERVYSIGLVIEIAGDVAASAVELMRSGHTYTAQALTRNLIECEYLIAQFAQDPEVAREWLNADEKMLRTYWSPQRLRDRMPGLFRNTEYWSHSETSHPTPAALRFLASHKTAVPADIWWNELALHLRRLSERCDEAIDAVGVGPAIRQTR